MRRDCGYIFALLLFSAKLVWAQQNAVDSLKKALIKANHDTIRLGILGQIGDAFFGLEKKDSAFYYFDLQIKEAVKKANTKDAALKKAYYNFQGSACNSMGLIKKQKGEAVVAAEYYQRAMRMFQLSQNTSSLASAHSNMASLLYSLGEPQKAIDEYRVAQKLLSSINDRQTLAIIYNNLGVLFQHQANIKAAIESYQEARKVFEKLNDTQSAIIVLINIGNIYKENGETERALEVFNETLKMSEQIAYKRGISESLSNIGFVYEKKGGFAKAEEYFLRSLKLNEERQNKMGIALQYNNLGILFKRKKNFAKAKMYYEKACKIRRETGDKQAIATSLTTMGYLFLEMSQPQKALIYAEEAEKLSNELGFPDYVMDAAKLMTKVHKQIGNYEAALRYYQIYVRMRDTINNEGNRKEALKADLKYEYEKKAAADSIKNAEAHKVERAQMEAQVATLKQKRVQFWFLGGGFVLIAAGLIFMIGRFRITMKQNKIIEAQKKETDRAYEKLHEKNKEVLDSIYYARRIQRTIITNEKYISNSLKKLSSP